MKIIGCDFGLRKSGVVVLNNQYQIESQNLIKVPQHVKGAQRLIDIERGFDAILSSYQGQHVEVFVEGYAYGAKYQRESLAELGGVIRRYLHLAQVDFWVIPPTSLKLFVTGTGKAKKNYMKKCTKDQWGEIFKSDDVCDAYGLSRLGMEVVNGVSPNLTTKQVTVVNDIARHQEYYKNSNTAQKRTRKKRTTNDRARTIKGTC